MTIDDLRRAIDAIDEQLVRLLNERAGCALEVGRLKTDAGLGIYQPDRERDVLHHVRGLNDGPLDDEAVTRLFERIIDENRRLERLVHESQEAAPGRRKSGAGKRAPGGRNRAGQAGGAPGGSVGAWGRRK